MNFDRRGPAAPPGRGWLWLAFVWGWAEATYFFIVPDVLTSQLVLRRPRWGLAACCTGLAGSVLGGALLFFIGRHFAPQLLGAFEYLPGINPALVDQAREDLIAHGPVALFTGGLEGIPYKLYASQAAGAGMGAGVFLLTSVLARLSRFLLVTGLAWLVGAKLLPNLSLAAKLRIRLGVWLSFYFLYFWQLGV